MDLESFKSLRLPGGVILLGIELEEAPMVDAIGRPALAKAVIEGNTVAVALAAGQASAEMSISIYHELLEALTVALAARPRPFAILMRLVSRIPPARRIAASAWQVRPPC